MIRSSIICIVSFLTATATLATAGGSAPSWVAAGNPERYQGLHNDIARLLQVQATPTGWVTVIAYDASLHRFLLNAIYSLVINKRTSYIVATLSEPALQECLQLQLPCYNASDVRTQVEGLARKKNPELAAQLRPQGADDSSSNTDPAGTAFDLYTPDYVITVWAKLVLLRNLLRLNYTVHFTDVDVVYFRDPYTPFADAMMATKADMLAMLEWVRHKVTKQWKNTVNSGVMLVQPSGLKTIQAWVDKIPHALKKGEKNQLYIAKMAFKEYIPCENSKMCTLAKAAGHQTMFTHIQQFADLNPAKHCPTTSWGGDPCAALRVYVHAICYQGWGSEGRGKGVVYDRLNLWLVDAAGEPMWSMDADLSSSSSATELKKHAFLPCKPLTQWA